MNDFYLPVILGTARPGNRSATVAHHVIERLKLRGIMTDLVDVADYELTGTADPGSGVDLDHYRDIVAAADGIVIVAPEYNHGYPGELKLLLDSEYDAYVRKPVGFVSVSAGALGGTRMVEQLRQVTAALRMVPVAPAVHVADVAAAIDDDGFSSNESDEVIDAMVDEIEWYVRRLTAPADASP